MPDHKAWGNSGAFKAPKQPCLRVHRQQTRLPLSTEETNRGFTGSTVRVSYQLNSCPFIRGMRSMASNDFSVSEMNSGKVKKPRSIAARRAFSSNPRLVVEIR